MLALRSLPFVPMLRSDRVSVILLATLSVVPMGEVDSRITKFPGNQSWTMLSTAAVTLVRSGRLLLSIGVGTAPSTQIPSSGLT